ncbi:hydroxymethylglutaryl-CoA synthase [Halarchaeum nitratireducens]|uniref:Hydroxymethylglutaryl-CoA synthase n=1 Tax=Halarchaeum nitratireducens TaxID=489913 RepID=A0A830G9U5_9EURY|nr:MULTISPECIES: hydroxymethylglutaryl-CoA synthase [Halarchaeum]MBP2250555.1 hydroxymethylglutaryl-CoA synthase [Halarchaeum solikamskense]GGN15280.1 hydroxymethylglutaryl-CoA synthase [Halarchaeum nitratireducens]
MTAVGIDAVEVWTGKLSLDLAETFAPEQGDDPAKYTKGLGLRESSFPDAHEDIVTMGANAAYRLMERKGLAPDDVGRIDVATESAFDNSKPVSTYIAGCLEQVYEGDFHHANKGERKFACIAGTQSLDDACNWIRAGRHRGRGALVIASDTALYERGDAGEATQGAGAVAMWVTEDPSLVALSVEQGYGSADETDFLKPNQQFPSVDGKRSIKVYLARMREALEDFESVAGRVEPDDYAYAPFHTPYPGMVRKAALLAYRHTIRGTDVEDALAADIGRQPRREAFDDEGAFEDAVSDYTDALKERPEYREWYDARIQPTLALSERVGNWYTGSVHLARLSALRHAAQSGRDLADEELLVASYGSGAQAEVHAETVREGWREEIDALSIFDRLGARYDLTFSEYERVHDRHNHAKQSEMAAFTTPEDEFVFDGWGPMNERTYRYVD